MPALPRHMTRVKDPVLLPASIFPRVLAGSQTGVGTVAQVPASPGAGLPCFFLNNVVRPAA